MRNFVIFAPHADDEIIGCFELLEAQVVKQVVFGTHEAMAECVSSKCNKHYGFTTTTVFLADLTKFKEYKNDTLVFPDPTTELHPEHRAWGALGERLAREGFDVIFYTTNMNAPYMRESKDPVAKKEALNTYYPEKKTLWRYEHKYFLFEGHIKWIMSWKDLGKGA